jgi:hypothetical protein
MAQLHDFEAISHCPMVEKAMRGRHGCQFVSARISQHEASPVTEEEK